MSDFKQQYKNPRLGFGDANRTRIKRAYEKDKSRKAYRTRAFDNNRMLQDSSPHSPQHEVVSTLMNERRKKLLKWREEQNQKKKLENLNKKPVFKVGIVHHSLYSPRTKNSDDTLTMRSSNQIKQPNEIPKRITRATEKRLKAKAATAAKEGNIKSPRFGNKKQKSFAPTNHEFKPPSGIKKIPLFGFVAIEPTPSEKKDFFAQEKLIKCQTHDSNNLKKKSQTLKTQVSNTTNVLTKSKNPKVSLSTKQESNQNVNETICDTNNATFDLNETVTMSSSLNEQTSLNNTNMKIPLQKTPLTNQSVQKNGIDDLIVFSPYVTQSRGKNNARKEQQLRLGIGNSPSDEIPTKDTVMKNLNISIEEEERTAQYFKLLLNKEIDRLRELCKKWLDFVQIEKDIPEDAAYEINQAVGQTNLLISKKFERFRNLVLDCETGKGERLVKCRDLQGFWDMTYMEVQNCDTRFEKLEQRRNREWEEDQRTVGKPAVKKRMPAKKHIVSSKPSSLRSFILAARKNMTVIMNKNDANINKKFITPSSSRRKSTSTKKENIETQYNTRKSIDSCKHISPSIQKMELSDTRKRMKSPFAIMKISQMCKTPEIQLNDTIFYVNSDQTPGKSILKKSEEMIHKESQLKSAHKVNFHDQVVVTYNFDDISRQNFDDLSSQISINAEKKLDFKTADSDSDSDSDLDLKCSNLEWFDEVPIKLKNNSKLYLKENALNFDITSTPSFKDSNSCIKMKSPKKNLKHPAQHRNTTNNNILSPTSLQKNIEEFVFETTSNATNMESKHDSEIRILRNRTITANDTPTLSTASRKSTPRKRSISKKENKSPKPSRSSLKISQKHENKYRLQDEDSAIETKENIKKRRSSQKSVAFNVETCVGCNENKPVLPMTPHSKRRSKTLLRQSQSKSLDEDLILWETPKHPPNRVTRSQSKKN